MEANDGCMDVDVDKQSVRTSETSRQPDIVRQKHEHRCQVIVDPSMHFPVWAILDVLWVVFGQALGSMFQGPMKHVRSQHSRSKCRIVLTLLA